MKSPGTGQWPPSRTRMDRDARFRRSLFAVECLGLGRRRDAVPPARRDPAAAAAELPQERPGPADAAAGDPAAARPGRAHVHRHGNAGGGRQRPARHRHRRHPVFPRAQRTGGRAHGRDRQFLQPVRDRAQRRLPRRKPAAHANCRFRPGQPRRLVGGLAPARHDGAGRTPAARVPAGPAGHRADGGVDRAGQACARGPAPAVGHRPAHARRPGRHGPDRAAGAARPAT